ncbi:hypothetical protein RUM43_003622 [Polyplax serrata]|uniref:Uncharacterized protein n=1 Tax=Polyplax serrata TaxID=468196 RepID=A0AAN8PPL5_POLSC
MKRNKKASEKEKMYSIVNKRKEKNELTNGIKRYDEEEKKLINVQELEREREREREERNWKYEQVEETSVQKLVGNRTGEENVKKIRKRDSKETAKEEKR